MNVYSSEASQLAAEVPRNRCPATDSLDWLDSNPAARLVLEETWTGPSGRVYREVPADRVSRWPSHLARSFRSLLRISRNPSQVFQLLDLLKELDAGPDVARATLHGCRKRMSLQPAIEYFEKLSSELAEVTLERPAGEMTLGTREPLCQTRVQYGEVREGSWYLSEYSTEPDLEGTSPSHRAEIIHDPTSTYGLQSDWITRQPRAFRRLYNAIRRVKVIALPAMKERLLELSAASSSHSRSQLEVLWSVYRIRRDYVRRREEQRVQRRMRCTAKKLIKRVRNIQSSSELGRVGKCLYEAMRGHIPLPGPVSQPEWAVVFEAYRYRKAEMIACHK